MQYNISTEKEIEERFWQIPEDLQDAAIDPKIGTLVKGYAKEHGVNEQLLWEVNHLVFNVFLAIDPIKGFAQRIAAQTQISIASAQKIADEINENIFRPVRASLIKIHDIPQSEQVQIPAVEPHFEHLLEIHSPGMIALAKSREAQIAAPTVAATPAQQTPVTVRPTTPKTLAEQKMSRPTSLPPQISRPSNEPDPYREAIN